MRRHNASNRSVIHAPVNIESDFVLHDNSNLLSCPATKVYIPLTLPVLPYYPSTSLKLVHPCHQLFLLQETIHTTIPSPNHEHKLGLLPMSLGHSVPVSDTTLRRLRSPVLRMLRVLQHVSAY